MGPGPSWPSIDDCLVCLRARSHGTWLLYFYYCTRTQRDRLNGQDVQLRYDIGGRLQLIYKIQMRCTYCAHTAYPHWGRLPGRQGKVVVVDHEAAVPTDARKSAESVGRSVACQIGSDRHHRRWPGPMSCLPSPRTCGAEASLPLLQTGSSGSMHTHTHGAPRTVL